MRRNVVCRVEWQSQRRRICHRAHTSHLTAKIPSIKCFISDGLSSGRHEANERIKTGEMKTNERHKSIHFKMKTKPKIVKNVSTYTRPNRVEFCRTISLYDELPVHAFVSSYVSSVHQFCARYIDFDGQMTSGHSKMPSQRYRHILIYRVVGRPITRSPHFYRFTLRQISNEPNPESNGLYVIRINFVLWRSEKSYDRKKIRGYPH